MYGGLQGQHLRKGKKSEVVIVSKSKNELDISSKYMHCLACLFCECFFKWSCFLNVPFRGMLISKRGSMKQLLSVTAEAWRQTA